MERVRRLLYRPWMIGIFLLVGAALLWLQPPQGHIIPSAVELQTWLREPAPFFPVTATRAEAIFGTALFIALGVSSWNWADAMVDFHHEQRRRPQNQGDYLAARSNFRRESYRLWRLTSMCLLASALLFNWALSTLFVTFGLLVFAYSEAVNSSLDRLYRLSAQALFLEEREKRRRILLTSRAARNAKVLADAVAGVQAGRIEVLEAQRDEDRDRQTEQADRMEAESGDTNERVRQVVRDIVEPQAKLTAKESLLTIGEQIEETHALATEALRTSNRAEEASTRAEETAARAEEAGTADPATPPKQEEDDGTL